MILSGLVAYFGMDSKLERMQNIISKQDLWNPKPMGSKNPLSLKHVLDCEGLIIFHDFCTVCA